MITCIIPAYNESSRIGQVISLLVEARKQGLINEIVVVSDGSSDDTAQVAKQAGADHIISYLKNRGKGYAIMSGLEFVKKGDILLLDADLVNLNINHIKDLITAAGETAALMVVGFLGDDIRQQIAPHLSGQRIIKRELVDKILQQKWENSRYNIEILMNRLTGKIKGKTIMIPLQGLRHTTKGKKYNSYTALYQKFLFSFGLAKIYKTFLFSLIVIAMLVLVGVVVYIPVRPLKGHWPAISPVTKKDRVLVIVAHPDDESIGASGFMYDAVRAGAKVTVVVVSNGDANKFSAGVLDKTILPMNEDYIREGEIRQAESQKALKSLGVTDVYFLGFPDRNLNKILTTNWDSPLTSKYSGFDSDQYPNTYKMGSSYQGNVLAGEIGDLIKLKKPTIIFTHMTEDTNSDHQAVSKFTTLAISELVDREIISQPNIYGFLVHWKFDEYPKPYRKAENFPLYPPEDLQNKCSWKIYPLSHATQVKKGDALQDYPSQSRSPSLDYLLKDINRTNELFCPVK